MVYASRYESPIGALLLAERDGKLIGVWIEGQKYFLGSLNEQTVEFADTPVLLRTQRWLDRYFNGERPQISELPLAPEGSSFRKTVWQALCEIPYGETVSYKEIAQRIANRLNTDRMSAQAVGGAVGHNPISIIIPCHRVVGANGSLTGYAGGIRKKLQLLALEGANVEKLSVPVKGTAL